MKLNLCITIVLCLLQCILCQFDKANIVIGYSDKATSKIQQEGDAHQQIQESLDNLKQAGGGTLRIEAGTYILSSNIEVWSNTAIIGAGINDTILKLVDRAKPWWIPGTKTRKAGFINSEDTVNLYFANFTIDGNKKNQNTDEYSVYGRFGVYTETCNNVVIDRMGVINFQGYGFDPHGVKQPKQWSDGLKIYNSYAAYNDWDGFTIDQSTNVLLQNNKAYGNGRHGFNIVTGTYNLIMYNNIAFDNGFYYYLGNPGCGLAIQNNLNYNTRNISVVNNIFQNNYDAGICLRDVSQILLKGNTIVNKNYTNTRPQLCIKLDNSMNVVSENNICANKLSVSFKEVPKTNTSHMFTSERRSSASGKGSVSFTIVMIALIVSTIIL